MRLQSLSQDLVSLDRPRCVKCHGEISIHQPDRDLPDRLLGTCPGCKAWFLMDSFSHVVFAVPCDQEIFAPRHVIG